VLGFKFQKHVCRRIYQAKGVILTTHSTYINIWRRFFIFWGRTSTGSVCTTYVGHGGHVWCLQKAMLIFVGSLHHWTKWFHSRIWYMVWYVIAIEFVIIYTFPCMEGFIPTSRGTSHGWLSLVLWCPWGWHWGMVPILVAKLFFHHQRSVNCIDTYPINHYHKGWCGSFHSWG